jgi:purine-binding chemotaxis protein CheW
MNKELDPKRESRQILVFYLGKTELGLEISCVREVLKPREIYPIPKAPPFIEGVINLRKHILVVIDLRKKLNEPPAEDQSRARIIICKIKTFIAGLLVDGVAEVLSLSGCDVQRPPEILSRQAPGACPSAIARAGDRVIAVLDLEKILTPEEMNDLSEMRK